MPAAGGAGLPEAADVALGVAGADALALGEVVAVDVGDGLAMATSAGRDQRRPAAPPGAAGRGDPRPPRRPWRSGASAAARVHLVRRGSSAAHRSPPVATTAGCRH